MKKERITGILGYFFILLFLYTGGSKLMDLTSFREQLALLPLLGSLAGVISRGLPVAEILLAVALFVPAWQLKGFYASLVLMVLFTAYASVLFFMDNPLSCGCGGIIEYLGPGPHLLFNSACTVLCGIAVIMKRRQAPTRRFQWVAAGLALGLFLAMGGMLFGAFSARPIANTDVEGTLLPAFQLRLMDGSLLNTANIPTGKPFLVIGFSPTCPHCRAETADIIKHLDRFSDLSIYFVSPFPAKAVRSFYEHYHLKDFSNIHVGQDSADIFLKSFKATGVPYNTVFSAQKRLKKAITGEIDAATLADALGYPAP